MKDRAVFNQIPNWGEKKSGKIAHEYVKMDGYTFDSQAEVDRYIELKLMQQKGIISELECQPKYELIPYQRVSGRQGFRKHGYTADFRYKDENGNEIVEDVKSVRTREERDYIINRKLMYFLHGIYVREVIR